MIIKQKEIISSAFFFETLLKIKSNIFEETFQIQFTMTITSSISPEKKEVFSLTISDLEPNEIRNLYQMISSADLPQRREFNQLSNYIKKKFVETKLL